MKKKVSIKPHFFLRQCLQYFLIHNYHGLNLRESYRGFFGGGGDGDEGRGGGEGGEGEERE